MNQIVQKIAFFSEITLNVVNIEFMNPFKCSSLGWPSEEFAKSLSVRLSTLVLGSDIGRSLKGHFRPVKVILALDFDKDARLRSFQAIEILELGPSQFTDRSLIAMSVRQSV